MDGDYLDEVCGDFGDELPDSGSDGATKVATCMLYSVS